MFVSFVCGLFFVPDQNAGTGQSAPRQHDVQLHQHLPDRGHQRAVESECWITLYRDKYLHNVGRSGRPKVWKTRFISLR